MSLISIVGIGMQSRLHLTLEGAREIALGDRVFHMVAGAETIAQLEQLNPATASLVGFYREGELDLHVYDRIVAHLIAEATRHERVVLVVMGHPSIYVAPTHLLTQRAPRHGIGVRVCAGVSAIDTILAGLPIDIANTGLQILDANRLVAYAMRPATDVPLLLFQAGCFGSGYITRTTVNSPGRLEPLVAYLARFYPAHHPVELLESAMGWPHSGVRRTLPLAELAGSGHLVNYNTTLLIPASQPLAIRNASFQSQLLDPAAVRRLVASS